MRAPNPTSLALLPLTLAVGCAASASTDGTDTAAEQSLIGDVVSMTQNPDGTFEVKCKSGRTESLVTADAIAAHAVCNGPAAPGGDPYSADSCTGPTLTEATALRYFTSDAPTTIGSYSVTGRTRVCITSGCTPWATSTELPFMSVYRWGASDDKYDVFPVDRRGSIVLSFVNGDRASHEAIELALVAAGSPVAGAKITFRTRLAGGFAATPPAYTLQDYLERLDPDLQMSTGSVYVGRGGFQNFSIPSNGLSSSAFTSGNSVELVATITDHCLRVALAGRDRTALSQGVFHAKFAPPAP